MSSGYLLELEAPQTQMLMAPLIEDQESLDMYESQQIHPSHRPNRPNFSASMSPGDRFFALDPYFQAQPRIDALGVREQLANLQRDYVLLGDQDLIADVLTAVPTLYSLLRQALQPIRSAFGERKLLHLEALQSDEDTVLRVMVKLPSDTQRPTELVRSFKRDWWLNNCSATEAALVFDYEISNEF